LALPHSKHPPTPYTNELQNQNHRHSISDITSVGLGPTVTTMDNVTISRIIIEQEPDWLRVQDNVKNSMMASMEARLSSLPGGKDGAAARGVRKELEMRLAKVCGFGCDDSSGIQSCLLPSLYPCFRLGSVLGFCVVLASNQTIVRSHCKSGSLPSS
jgi:hypothetical protein